MNLKNKFHSFFKSELNKRFPSSSLKGQKLLRKSLLYTLKSPCSFFRPQLALATTKALNKNPDLILPWAMAIEMIHVGSLIQDDLPCMDNATLRRSKKSNHLVFQEDMALLAGSTLFVESFSYLLYPSLEKKQGELLSLLIQKSGYKGMMSGQALDIRQQKSVSKKMLLKTLELKTGALIEACVAGPVILFSKKRQEKSALLKFAKILGQAYQVADDLEENKSNKNLQKILRNLTAQSLLALEPIENSDLLKKLSLYNEKRAKS